MAQPNISPYGNPQLQSQLVCLPMEIKHMITSLCLTAEETVEDPFTTTRGNNNNRARQSLGIAILQTCRRLYHETDRRPLFSRNVFRFTSPSKMRDFLRLLEYDHRLNVNDLEIDIRCVHSDHPALARDWLQYLKQHPEDKSQSFLQEDAPGLKSLRLNFGSWPRIPMFRTELWNLLRHLLSDIHGLERIMVIGASKGQAMARRSPWSPAHYVGADDIGANDLVPQMWSCVEAPDDQKYIRWNRNNGSIQLEVVSGTRPMKHGDCDRSQMSAQIMEENGWCDWNSYVSLGSMATDLKMR